MVFHDLQSANGLQQLDSFLVDKSYIQGYYPTQEDNVVFEAMKKSPPAEFNHVRRWYQHIASFSDDKRRKFEASQSSKKVVTTTDDDGFDPFADEDENEKAEAKQRLANQVQKEAEKPVEIAKSCIVLDVKPWDDETNMKELEENVRSIELDGLLWGVSQLVPLAFTINMLQITCVVEDDKVGTDDLEERIMEFRDHVQSVDIASFRKI